MTSQLVTKTFFFVQTAEHATYCFDKLHKRIVNGERKMIPSEEELAAIRDCKSLVIRIFFMNETKKGIPIDSTTTAQEAIVTIANKVS